MDSGNVEDVLVGSRGVSGDGIMRYLLHKCMGGVGVSFSTWFCMIS